MNEFKNKIKKVSESRNHSITNSYGVKDAFIYYKKTRPEENIFVLSDAIYRTLIREVNELLIEELLSSGELKLPVDMGQIRIYKKENKPVIKEGKVYYNAPIDWGKTLELWSSDNESKVSKTLVKVMPGDIYTFKYKHHYSKFKNKEYYIFKFNRQLKLSLKHKIINKKEIPYFSQFKKLN